MLAVAHERGFAQMPGAAQMQEKQFSEIAHTLDKNQPKMVLIEGTPNSEGINPCSALDKLLTTPKGAGASEILFTKYQAVNRGILIAGWEPSDNEMIDLVNSLTSADKQRLFKGVTPHGEKIDGATIAFTKLNNEVIFNLAPELVRQGQNKFTTDALVRKAVSLCQKGNQSVIYLAFERGNQAKFDSSHCTPANLQSTVTRYLAYAKAKKQDLLSVDLRNPGRMMAPSQEIEDVMDTLRDASLRLSIRAGLE